MWNFNLVLLYACGIAPLCMYAHCLFLETHTPRQINSVLTGEKQHCTPAQGISHIDLELDVLSWHHLNRSQPYHLNLKKNSKKKILHANYFSFKNGHYEQLTLVILA